jgi:hypothetical protein
MDPFFDIPDPLAEDCVESATPPLANPPAFAKTRTRAQVKFVQRIAPAAAIFSAVGLAAMMGLRSPTSASSLAYGVLAPLAFSALILRLAPSSLSGRVRFGFVLFSGLLVFSLTAIQTRGPGDGSARSMMACVMAGTMMSIAPLLIAFAATRHSFVTQVALRTASLGLSAGLIGAAAVRLHCPNDALVHLLLAHGTPIVLLTAIVAAFGSRVTRA